MAVMGWVVVLPVCKKPVRDLPRDTRLHWLWVGLLDVEIQGAPPLHASFHEHVRVAALPQLQVADTEGPTMVWHRDPPGRHYREWVSHARHVVLTITPAQPLKPWIQLRVETGALLRYPARCLTHKCLGHPNKSPLYMALHAPDALLLELDPALRTQMRENLGVHATLYPHQAPTAAPVYLRPRADPGMWLHEVPLSATMSRAIIATNAGTTPAGMTMAPAYEHAPGWCTVRVASGVGPPRRARPYPIALCLVGGVARRRLLGGAGF